MKIRIIVLALLTMMSLNAYADDSIFLVSPDNSAIYLKDERVRVDFSLTQKIQKQFFDLLDLLNQQNINTIIANGRVESTNSYNNNWFFVYTYNKERFLSILPQKDTHRSNIRPEYIEHLLNNNAFPITKTEDLYRKIDHKIFFDVSDFVLDRNHNKFYIYHTSRPGEHMLTSIAKNLRATITWLKPNKNLPLKISQIMNVNEQMVMICPSCFLDPDAYKQLKAEFTSQNKVILEINERQAASNSTDFIVVNANHQRYILYNKQSFETLNQEHTKALLEYGKLIIVDLSAFYEYNQTKLRDMLTIIN